MTSVLRSWTKKISKLVFKLSTGFLGSLNLTNRS